jgi:hypothetical protein
MNIKSNQDVLLVGTPGTGRTMWAKRQKVPFEWLGLSGRGYGPRPLHLHRSAGEGVQRAGARVAARLLRGPRRKRLQA